MKKRNFLYGATLALTLGSLASCSDDLTTEVQKTVDHDQVRYLNVTISNTTGAGTRAADTDFLTGSDEENFVENMVFVFYDADGNPTGQAHELKFATNTTTEGFAPGVDDNPSVNGGNVGRIWQSTVPVQLAQGDNLPAYVMCFINPVSNVEFKTLTKDALDDAKRQKVVNDKGNFGMTNSVYYGTNPITGEENVRMVATPITTQQLYPSSEEAEKEGATTTDIYVERYASRISLNLATNAVQPNTESVNGYTLTFVPEYWRVNSTDTEFYAVKRFGVIENDETIFKPTYGQLLATFETKTWWNDAEKNRSYWGCTPSYYENNYPRVSDDITDIAQDNDYDEDNYPFKVHYFNYNQFANNTVSGITFRDAIEWDATNGFNKVFYARETTTVSSAWGYVKPSETATKKSYNPLATIPSAVIIGHYTVTKTTGTTDVPAVENGNPTFYLYGKFGDKHNLYFESNILEAMINNQSVVLVKDNDKGTYSEYKDAAGYKIEHPTKAVRDVKHTIVAGRLVALQLNGTNLDNLYYYDATATGEKYVKITNENLNKVNSDLLSAGYAAKYGDGIAYFNIPIEHLGIYATATNNTGTYVEGAKPTANNVCSYDFKKCPAGSFGIVRNHAYTINVTSISGLGTALRDKNQPIVPPVDDVTYHISAKLNILNWRIVPTQNVAL